MSAGVEVVTIGRSGVDIYPLQTGVGLEDVETFGKFLGSPDITVGDFTCGREGSVLSVRR